MAKTEDETSQFWFHNYHKSDFSKFFLIDSYICWAYWGITKYRRLAEDESAEKARAFIDKHRVNIENSISTASALISGWSDAPQTMRVILEEDCRSTIEYIKDETGFTDSAIFHKSLGITKKESIDGAMTTIDRELRLVRNYLQLADRVSLKSLYYRWLHGIYSLFKGVEKAANCEEFQELTVGFEDFLDYPFPSRKEIHTALTAEINYLQIPESLKQELIKKLYVHWGRLFASASVMSASCKKVMLVAFEGEEEGTVDIDSAINEAGRLQIDASLAIASLSIEALSSKY